jgi:hypothetical protein
MVVGHFSSYSGKRLDFDAASQSIMEAQEGVVNENQ